jgi:membrane-bound lytic murein transglycosylase D
MRRTGAKTYWDLVKTGSLSEETSQYVARFAALVIIYRNQELLGLDIEKPRPIFAETETINFTQSVNIADIAEICGTTAAALKSLNPDLLTDRTPPAPHRFALRIPKGAGRLLHANERMVSAVAVKNPARMPL